MTEQSYDCTHIEKYYMEHTNMENHLYHSPYSCLHLYGRNTYIQIYIYTYIHIYIWKIIIRLSTLIHTLIQNIHMRIILRQSTHSTICSSCLQRKIITQSFLDYLLNRIIPIWKIPDYAQMDNPKTISVVYNRSAPCGKSLALLKQRNHRIILAENHMWKIM